MSRSPTSARSPGSQASHGALDAIIFGDHMPHPALHVVVWPHGVPATSWVSARVVSANGYQTRVQAGALAACGSVAGRARPVQRLQRGRQLVDPDVAQPAYAEQVCGRRIPRGGAYSPSTSECATLVSITSTARPWAAGSNGMCLDRAGPVSNSSTDPAGPRRMRSDPSDRRERRRSRSPRAGRAAAIVHSRPGRAPDSADAPPASSRTPRPPMRTARHRRAPANPVRGRSRRSDGRPPAAPRRHPTR